jgi:hypothetical protein
MVAKIATGEVVENPPSESAAAASRPVSRSGANAGRTRKGSPHKRELVMADQPQQLEVIDPDNVPETLCEGMFNVSFAGPLAVITFTHMRPEPGQLFAGTVNPKLIVRSRIVTSVPNLVSLRDLLNRIIETVSVPPAAPTPAPATGGPTRH